MPLLLKFLGCAVLFAWVGSFVLCVVALPLLNRRIRGGMPLLAVESENIVITTPTTIGDRSLHDEPETVLSYRLQKTRTSSSLEKGTRCRATTQCRGLQ